MSWFDGFESREFAVGGTTIFARFSSPRAAASMRARCQVSSSLAFSVICLRKR